jgi:putative flippase GtrA
MIDPISSPGVVSKDMRGGLLSGVTSHIPPGQFLRYLLVGGWNTVFGYTCFFLMNRFLSTMITAYPYIVAGLASSLINITVAFLGYKWFVFRTKGKYLREWLRTLAIYSGSIVFSTLALAPLVGLIRHTTPYRSQAPYIAAAIVMAFTVVGSFFGHRHFSFRRTVSLAETDERQHE